MCKSGSNDQVTDAMLSQVGRTGQRERGKGEAAGKGAPSSLPPLVPLQHYPIATATAPHRIKAP